MSSAHTALDSRLIRYTRGTRRHLAGVVLIGGVTAGLIVAQAWLIANLVARVVVGHETLGQVLPLIWWLGLVILGRSTFGWFRERMADRASASAKSDLRVALVTRIARLGPAAIDRERPGSLVVLATSGIDALDNYFARYLPQLILAAIVPVTVVLMVSGADWTSAVIIVVTIPLIPIFMALVGASTRVRMSRQARLLERLSGHFLDVVAGLPGADVHPEVLKEAHDRQVRPVGSARCEQHQPAGAHPNRSLRPTDTHAAGPRLVLENDDLDRANRGNSR